MHDKCLHVASIQSKEEGKKDGGLRKRYTQRKDGKKEWRMGEREEKKARCNGN